MNKKTVDFVDMLVEIAMEKWRLPASLPLKKVPQPFAL